MTTPTRNEIIQKATEDYMKENWKISTNNPEVDELKEGGFYNAAKDELMRSVGNEAQIYLEELANQAGFDLVKTKNNDHIEKYDCDLTYKFNLPFNIEEAKKSNILVSGTNCTGKSRLSCYIASILQTLNWKIVVFDPCGVYQKISDIPFFYTVTKHKNYDTENKVWLFPFPKISMIFDMSLLKPCDQKKFTDAVLDKLWTRQVKNGSQWILIILEESQMFMQNIRGSISQSILRICSAGRNHKIRMLAVTPDLALLDTAYIRLSQQRYHGKLAIEENSKRKFRAYYGGDWCRVATELDLGYFVYMLKNKLKIVNLPCFETKRISVAYDTQRLVTKSA